MKIFKRVLYALLLLCLAALVVALAFRIYISDHYPKDSVRFVMTDALEDYYEQTNSLKAYTQELRTPYDDSKNASFFADGLYVLPDASHLQITMRYNVNALETVAEKYEREEAIEPRDGLFRYVLTVSYNKEASGQNYQSYESSYLAESEASLYRYAKLAFDGVSFDGARWARVDIYLDGEEECFGSVIVYEANFEYGGNLYPYELEEKKIPKGDLPS